MVILPCEPVSALKGYATATDLADDLVKKVLPFRDAHEAVAHALKIAIGHGIDLLALPFGRVAGAATAD